MGESIVGGKARRKVSTCCIRVASATHQYVSSPDTAKLSLDCIIPITGLSTCNRGVLNAPAGTASRLLPG